VTESEFNALTYLAPQDPTVSVDDLTDKSDRTLIFGYTCERNTFHVYLKDGKLHLVLYRNPGAERVLVKMDCQRLNAATCVPDKRVYPEDCDLEFCRLLTRAGVTIPFTTFSPERAAQPSTSTFRGKTREELTYIAEHLLSMNSDIGSRLGEEARKSAAELATTLGLWGYELHSHLDRAINEACTGYLRFAVLEGEVNPRWLTNIPFSVEAYLSRAGTHQAVKLPFSLSSAILAYATELADNKKAHNDVYLERTKGLRAA
jgi:hypothetical protein